jgi:hypothetical protein
MRDEFDQPTKDMLARRVGHRCSNPNCRQLTSGPQSDPEKALNIGVAAHICAAAPGGKRYKASMSAEERKSIENGIWCCQNCGKLVDNDEIRYTENLLLDWKRLSEQAALLEIENPRNLNAAKTLEDLDLLRFYSQCFDRPAFQDEFRQEGSTEAFDRAIEDTIIAINTGTLRSRDGMILSQSKGKSFLVNSDWREQMDVIVDLLRSIRSRYALGVRLGQIYLGTPSLEHQIYCINDHEIVDFFDTNRSEIMRLFSALCKDAGIPELHFPRSKHRNRTY